MATEERAIDYSTAGLPGRLVRAKDAAAVRARRKIFMQFIGAIHTDDSTRILDVGVTPEQGLASNNFLEELYPRKDRITATSIEDASLLEARYPGLRFVRTDGATLPFADNEFDVAFSSAVLEHVGDREHQRSFLRELLRVANHFFITTPNRWFPLDLHTALPVIHWLPQTKHQAILRSLGKDFWASTDNLNLVSASSLRALFPPEVRPNLVRFRTLGLTSNLIAHGWSGNVTSKPVNS